jgi:hypothetical protein
MQHEHTIADLCATLRDILDSPSRTQVKVGLLRSLKAELEHTLSVKLRKKALEKATAAKSRNSSVKDLSGTNMQSSKSSWSDNSWNGVASSRES